MAVKSDWVDGQTVHAADLNASADVVNVTGNAVAVEGSASPAFPELALYTWHEFLDLHDAMSWLGLQSLRQAGGVTDTTMAECIKLGYKAAIPVVGSSLPSIFPSDAAVVAAFISDIDTVLTRYGPNGSYFDDNREVTYLPIEIIEIDNEPNFNWPARVSGATSSVPALYAKVLIACYDHIKATWPTVTVVGFCAGDAAAAAPTFIADVFTADPRAAHSCDAIGFQPYCGNQPPDGVITEAWGTWTIANNIGYIRGALHAHGIDDKPLWVTETGFKISHDDGGLFPNDAAGDVDSPLQQAAFSVRMAMVLARCGISHMAHMFIVDSDGYNGGFFDGSGNPRPRATATRLMNKLLRGASRLEILADGGTSGTAPFVYRFTTPRGRVVCAWSQTATGKVIPLDGPSDVVDVVGTAIESVTDTSYTTTLTETPIFIYESTGTAGPPPPPPDPVLISNFDFHEGTGTTTTSLVGSYTLTGASDAWVSGGVNKPFSGFVGPNITTSNYSMVFDVTAHLVGGIFGISGESNPVFGSFDPDPWFSVEALSAMPGIYPPAEYGTIPLPDGTRCLIGFTNTASNIKVFVAGVLAATFANTHPINPGTTTFVLNNQTFGHWANVVFHGVRFWSPGLSDTAMAALT